MAIAEYICLNVIANALDELPIQVRVLHEMQVASVPLTYRSMQMGTIARCLEQLIVCLRQVIGADAPLKLGINTIYSAPIFQSLLSS
jgi:hypothetical protein